MKNMSMKMMAIITGMGIVGYMYLKSHPEMLEMMKEIGTDTKEKITDSMD